MRQVKCIGKGRFLKGVFVSVFLLILFLANFKFWVGPVHADQLLPDLDVVNVYLDSYCFLNVAIANRGRAGIPRREYSLNTATALLLVYLDGRTDKPWAGGFYMVTVDPSRYLTHPSGSVTYTIHKVFPHGAHRVEVRIVAPDIEETRVDNNTLVKTLSCNRRLPDLVIRGIGVRKLNGKCAIEITIENKGGAIPPCELDKSNLYIKKGNEIRIYRFRHNELEMYCGVSKDPLLRPGGKITLIPDRSVSGSFALFPEGTSVRVTAWIDPDLSQQFNGIFSSVTESNENNNKLTRTLMCIRGPEPSHLEKVPKAKSIQVPLKIERR